ncbi:hypothetical protein NKH98_32260 [Mesorhizobium sp. M0833]|uniref:hypothetical protein n=1 Tax=Mesorhizobium sp. M0833 TaxID=2957009 RepID=UPI00333C0375
MAHDPIDTLGKATRHNMLVKAECSCGNVRYCRSADLMMVYGDGADPLKLRFDCSRCKLTVKITLLEVHPEHLPKRLVIHKPVKVDGKIRWTTEQFRGQGRGKRLDPANSDRLEDTAHCVLPQSAVSPKPAA